MTASAERGTRVIDKNHVGKPMNELGLTIVMDEATALENLVVGEVRELTQEDILDSMRRTENAPFRVQKVRQSHHEIARLIASGMLNVEVAKVVGRSYSMVASLVRSPAFQELVSYYQERRDEETFQLTSRIQSLASDALEELEDRINGDKIDDVKTRDLAGIATSLLDRAGHSPVSRRESRNLHVHLTEDDISEIKREATQKKIINGEATQVD